MSNVLEFRPASAGGPAQCRDDKVTAEIVIFPGIRYERTPDSSRPSPEPKNGGRRSPRRGVKSG